MIIVHVFQLMGERLCLPLEEKMVIKQMRLEFMTEIYTLLKLVIKGNGQNPKMWGSR